VQKRPEEYGTVITPDAGETATVTSDINVYLVLFFVDDMACLGPLTGMVVGNIQHCLVLRLALPVARR
jgi:hypothetical protein